MVQERTCDYTGEDIEPGTGTMFVKKDGSILWFKDSKAKKNYMMGRESRDLEWIGYEETEEATEAPEDEEATEAPEDEEEEAAESDVADEEEESDVADDEEAAEAEEDEEPDAAEEEKEAQA